MLTVDFDFSCVFSAPREFSDAALVDFVDREGWFLREPVFGRPGSIVALFGSGRNFILSNVASGFSSSTYLLPYVFMPGSSACWQFSTAGKSIQVAHTGQTDSGFLEPGMGELEKIGESESDEDEGTSSNVADSDFDELEVSLSSDCSAVDDAARVQRLLKTHRTHEERVEALSQCGVVVSEDLVVRVLYRHKNDWKPAMYFFLWASRQPGYSHGTDAYNAMLNILGKMKRFRTMWQLVKEMHERGNSPSLITDRTFTILIRRYAAAHMVERAIETLYKREEFGLKLDTPAFQTLLGALCRYKHVKEAEALFHLREQEFPPDMKSRNIILNGWCAMTNLREAKRFWNELIKQGHTPNLMTYGTFINALTKKGKLETALKLFQAMWNKGCTPDVAICNNIIDSLCYKNRIPEALSIFAEMNEPGCLPDVVTYNSLIKHMCDTRRVDKAYEFLDEMEQKGCVPNVRTYHYFLRVARKPEMTFKIMQRMVETGCKPTNDTYNLVLRMLLGWNELDRAVALWDDMEKKGMGPDCRSYTVMIHGLYDKGKFIEAYKYFNKMNAKGLAPEARTKILVKAIEIKAKESKPEAHDAKKHARKKKKQPKFSGKVKS
eukprot:Gb_12359 [translate_table: standard]